LKAFFFYDILITLKQVRKTESLEVIREFLDWWNRNLWKKIWITFKIALYG